MSIRYLAALSTAISTAINEWGWMEENPLRKVSKLKEQRGRVQISFRLRNVNVLLIACKESHNHRSYTLTVILAMSTGGRRAEIWGLSWKCVDLQEWLHHIRGNKK